MSSVAPQAAIRPKALTDGATITPDCQDGNRFHVILGGNRTIAAPLNPTPDMGIMFRFTQDGTGSRTLTWNAAFDFGTAGAPVLSAGANKRDYIAGVYDAVSGKWDMFGASLGHG